MPADVENPHALQFERRPVRAVPARVNAEPLPSNRVPVLQAGIADIAAGDTGKTRKLTRQPLGIGVGFLEQQEIVLAVGTGFETQLFDNDEVFRPRPDTRAKQRAAVRPGVVRLQSTQLAAQ